MRDWGTAQPVRRLCCMRLSSGHERGSNWPPCEAVSLVLQSHFNDFSTGLTSSDHRATTEGVYLPFPVTFIFFHTALPE